jgi:E3 ubiquitin-protein ligase HUWE1
LFLAKEKLQDTIKKDIVEEELLPTVAKVISEGDDYCELPAPEAIGSFTRLRENNDIDFNLIFSNFGLKYSGLISKLAREPNGSMREEIWHLNHKFPWIFEFSTKKEIFKKITKQIVPETDLREKIVIERANVVHDLLKQCSKPGKDSLYKLFSITFQGEAGIDDGGLRREFYSLVAEKLFNPDFGLFKLSGNGQSIQPSPQSRLIPYHLKLFEFCGIILAKVSKG